jgi:hypothetical protein
MSLSPEERESLSTNIQVPQRTPRSVVEHTPHGSFADMSDLAEKVHQEYIPHLQMHGVRKEITCEATESGDGHSGAATHFIRMPGEGADQIEAVCAVHHARLMTSALEKGGYDVASRRIHPNDIQPHLLHRAEQGRVMRTAMEAPLYAAGLRGEDALFYRKSEELGKGGGKRRTHLEELKSRRTPEHARGAVEAALERVRAHGGRNPAPEPTIEFNGEDISLGDSYGKVASLRRKTEAPIPGARPGNTENYYMAGVKSPDGSVESAPSSTRRLGINKAGVPNPKGGRKKNTPVYDYDTSNENKPGYTEEEMIKNPDLRKSSEERAAAGIPVGGIQPRGFSKTNNKALKVTMTQLPKTKYPGETIGESDGSETARYIRERKERSTSTALSDISANLEAERLRGIEAKKTATSSRNKAFRVDWNDVPRPE